MITRNQLAAELNALTQKYMYDSADDSQGFADEVLVMLHAACRDALLEGADRLECDALQAIRRASWLGYWGHYRGYQKAIHDLRDMAGGQ